MSNSLVVEFTAICIHSLFYGLYILLFGACIYILLSRYRTRNWEGHFRPVDTVLLTVSIVLFSLITAHWVLRFVVLLEAFAEPSVYLDDLHGRFSDPRLVAADALCIAEIIVADLTMVYRLYFVWGKSKRVIIAPLITASLSIGFAIAVVVNEDLSTNNAAYITNDMRWTTILCLLELVTNVMVTALMAYRIWYGEQAVKILGQTSIMPIVHILVESAAIYTVFLILIPVSVLTQNLVLTDLALDIASPAIGIAFSLIIIRVGLGKAIEDHVRYGRINDTQHLMNPIVTFGED